MHKSRAHDYILYGSPKFLWVHSLEPVTCLVRRIFRWSLDFWKICAFLANMTFRELHALGFPVMTAFVQVAVFYLQINYKIRRDSWDLTQDFFRYMIGRHMLHPSAASACQYNGHKPPEGDACWVILCLSVTDDTVLTAISWKCHNQ